MKYQKLPVIIEAITFDELVEYGRIIAPEDAKEHDGFAWSFSYNGHTITHENDECYLIPTLEGVMNMTPEDMLITGVKGEIYPCKKDIFDQTYQEVQNEGMTFGQALEALKTGKKVAREGWNGKGMFLFLLPGGTIPKSAIYDGALASVVDEVEGDSFEALPTIRMWTTNSSGRKAVLTGWLASQTDMLSDDWVIVE